MLLINSFYGIIIRMFHNDHNLTHFHTEYKAVIDIAASFITG